VELLDEEIPETLLRSNSCNTGLENIIAMLLITKYFILFFFSFRWPFDYNQWTKCRKFYKAGGNISYFVFLFFSKFL